MRKNGGLYFMVLTAIDNYSPIIVDVVLLPNNSENTFFCSNLIQKHILHKIDKKKE